MSAIYYVKSYIQFHAKLIIKEWRKKLNKWIRKIVFPLL